MEILDKNNKFTKEFFVFLKYNQISDKVILSKTDEALYNEFSRKVSFLIKALSNSDNSSSSIFGSLASMFGFNRHYCSISGKPIIGKFYKIGGKIVSKEAYESYKIIQVMESQMKTTSNLNIDKDK